MIAALVHGPLIRLVPVGLVLLALQTTLFTDVRPAGVVLQVVLAFAAAAGVAGGPERGMLVGFVMGVMFDLGTGTPLGSSAITISTSATETATRIEIKEATSASPIQSADVSQIFSTMCPSVRGNP